MDGAASPKNIISRSVSDPALDFDILDERLMGECTSETETNQWFDLFKQAASSTSLLDSSCFSLCGINGNSSNSNLQSMDNQHRPFSPDNLPSVGSEIESFIGSQYLVLDTMEASDFDARVESHPASLCWSMDESSKTCPSSKLSCRYSIQPGSNLCLPSSVKERLVLALGHVKEFTEGSDVLVQVWVPTKKGGRHVLTTYDQPFLLDTTSEKLVNYRSVSVRYYFAANRDSNESVGLPGRVFLGRLPEWTPDVWFFSSEEYPRVDHARQNDVHGTLAVPIFEQGSALCLGVIEVVMTTKKIKYSLEIESICTALQAVNFRTSAAVSVPYIKEINHSYQVVLPEILQVLKEVCDSHKLPLAQTWIPCMQQGKKGGWHSDENYAACISTVDIACYASDPYASGFHEACSEHHLLRGQGLPGKAFATNQLCFSPDVTSFVKAEYPLSHYAQMFGLRAAAAIRLRSVYTGTFDYVLEFFLPIECQDVEEQKMMFNSLSLVLKQVCQSLRVVETEELEEGFFLKMNDLFPSARPSTKYFSADSGSRTEHNQIPTGIMPASVLTRQKAKSSIPATMPLEYEKSTDDFGIITQDFSEVVKSGQLSFPELNENHQGPMKDSFIPGDSPFGERCVPNAGDAISKRRARSEKNISLQVLRQYFAGSLKDAAKSIGVCPTTLKRICRQHGITRWPSRKIKKVSHSLKKLQGVMDSVQGVDGALHINSLYSSFQHMNEPDLTASRLSGDMALCASKPKTTLSPSSMKHEDLVCIRSPPTKPQSPSCSQSSNGSLGCSTAAQQLNHPCPASIEDASVAEEESGVLNRPYIEQELHESTKDEEKPPLQSISDTSLDEHPSAKRGFSCLKGDDDQNASSNSYVRVKAIYKDDKVRFRMYSSWGLQELEKEVAKRFNIDDMTTFSLKYLDDDSEWVLLTCDDDLQECKEIYKLGSSHLIKLSVNYIAQ